MNEATTPDANDHRYDLFISYRRADASALAQQLRWGLQSFRLPAEVARALAPGARTRYERGLRVYLDVAYERAGEDFLTGKVLPALDASRCLLVVSTPTAFDDITDANGRTQPNWLCREVEHFFDQRGAAAERATVVVLGPQAPVDRFPGRLAVNERWDWIDLRAFRRFGWQREVLDAAVVKIVGWLLAVPDELLPVLHQEQRRRRQRLLKAVAGIALAVATGMAGLAAVAVVQRGIAVERLRLAQQQQSTSLAALADLKLSEGNGTLAQLLALEGLPQSGRPARPYVAAAEAALYRAAAAGRERWLLDVGPCSPVGLAFARRAPLLLVGCFAGNGATEPLLIDANTGRILARLVGHKGRVEELVFRADDHQLATGSADGTVRLWDPVTGREQARFSHNGPVNAVMFDLSGGELLSASEDGTAALWDIDSGRRKMELAHGGGQGARALYDAATRRVLTLNPQIGQATLWLAANGVRLQVLAQANVRDALFTDQDRSLITAGNGRATLWRWNGERYVAKAQLGGHANAFGGLAASPDGRYVATCSYDGTARLWDSRTGALAGALSLGPTNTCFAVAFSADSDVLATGDDRAVRLWRVPSLRPLQTLTSRARPVIRLAFRSDGSLASSAEEWVSLWDARPDPMLVNDMPVDGTTDLEVDPITGQAWRLNEAGDADRLGFDGTVTPLPGFARAGTRAMLRFDDGQWLRFLSTGDVELAATPSADALLRLPAQGGKAPRLAYTRAGPWLVVAEGARLRVHDRRALAHAPRVIEIGAAPVERVALDEAADLLVASGGRRISAYALSTLDQKWSASGLPAESDKLLIADSGQRLIGTWKNGSLRIWDIVDSHPRCTWETGDEPIYDLTVSPDGQHLVLGTDLTRFFALRMQDCTEVHAFDRPDGFALGMGIVFTRSGRRVITAAGDGWVHLWDMATGSLLQAFDAGPRAADGSEQQAEALDIRLALSPQEDRLMVTHDKGIRIWSLLPEGEALAARVKSTAPRRLSDQERAAFGLAP